jgi:hypothetical protein
MWIDRSEVDMKPNSNKFLTKDWYVLVKITDRLPSECVRSTRVSRK